MDVRAPFSGVLEAQLAKIDENVLVGAPLFSVVKQDGSASKPATASTPVAAPTPVAAAPAASSAAEELSTVNVPSMGDSISEGTIVTIFKRTSLL